MKMAINEVEGDLLAVDAEALVNTVNCVGVMGKGVALQFKRRYPKMFSEYKRACDRGEVRIGHMHLWETGLLQGPRYIINFPTKEHWKGRSRLEWIREGLVDLRRVIVELGLESVAMPPLGAGNGGLDWTDVEPIIQDALGDLDASVSVFAPSGGARPVEGRVRIQMSRSRALVLNLMKGYGRKREQIEPWEDAQAVSHLEIQKLMYFADVIDPDLRLNFGPGRYGPYSDKVRIVLQEMEGRYVEGFGDGSGKPLSLDPIRITDEGERELARFASTGHGRSVQELASRVLVCTDGFEDPYGVELLASTLYVAQANSSQDPATVARGVRTWTERKGILFTDEHVAAALKHLELVTI